MNLQIKSIILYNSHGKQRVINFQLGKVNIITGSSKRGKSSIINIIDYCLGRDEFQIKAGVISDNVEWYGILCIIDDLELFIAKPKPKYGYTTQSEAYFVMSKHVEIPEFKDLIINSTDSAIITELSNKTGIAPNLHTPSAGQTREQLEANFSHAKLLLFQPQGVIANPEVLFYRQTDIYMTQAIRDTLLYFLGIVQEDRLKTLHRLQEKRRQYKLLKSNLDESEDIKDSRTKRGKGLIEEAKQIGILDSTVSSDNIEEIIKILTPLKDWKPSVIPPAVDSDILSQKQDELINKRKTFEEIKDRIKAAETHVLLAENFVGEANQQLSRLESIGLYESPEEKNVNICPLCGNPQKNESSLVSSLNTSIKSLESEVDFATKENPKFIEYIQNQKKLLEVSREEINQIEFEISSLIEEDEKTTNFRDTNNRIFRVVGRISYYLDITSNQLDEEIKKIISDMSSLELEIKELEHELDSKNIEDQKMSVLNLIGIEMTKFSQMLDLEHEYPYRFDLNKLTVVADKPGNPIIMNQNMGSAANHLGSHIITLLALHSYFIKQKRPVPSFVVLDQPSQVYFPQDKDLDGDTSILSDEDRLAIEKVFNVLFKVSNDTGLQIIVLEHANLLSPEFQSAIVDLPWRGENALIPTDWI